MNINANMNINTNMNGNMNMDININNDIENIYFNCMLTKKIIVQSKYLNENSIQNYNNVLKTNVSNTIKNTTNKLK
jgi:hypothetical protein